MRKRERIESALLAVAILYSATAAIGGTMIQRARPNQAPVVIPVIPFVLASCDTTGLVGENTMYVWYGIGIKRIWKRLKWIA